jgi:glycosyltransferase involved in cell wall biosynthesis
MASASVSIVIPAYNEAERIGSTLEALHAELWDGGRALWREIIVVDDGSVDDTYRMAYPYADRMLRHPRRKGKGAAMESGWRHASGDIIVFLDADLGQTASCFGLLVEPILEDRADLCIGVPPAPKVSAGIGLARGLARSGIERLTGYEAKAPLSGQRAVRRELLQSISPICKGFGAEVGMTIDALHHGARICEVNAGFSHRESMNNWAGWLHRGRQWVDIAAVLLVKSTGSPRKAERAVK